MFNSGTSLLIKILNTWVGSNIKTTEIPNILYKPSSYFGAKETIKVVFIFSGYGLRYLLLYRADPKSRT
jgi:hypothetical protein